MLCYFVPHFYAQLIDKTPDLHKNIILNIFEWIKDCLFSVLMTLVTKNNLVLDNK